MNTTTDASQADRQRQHLSAIVECATDAIFSLTLDGQIITWNGSAERLYGYTSADVIGASVEILLPSNSASIQAQLAEDRWILGRGGVVPFYEAIRRRKDGRNIDLSIGVFPLSDSGGVVTGIGVISRDITGRQALEDQMWRLNANLESRLSERTLELAEIQQQLRYRGDVMSTIVDSMSDGLIVLDGEHRIQFCNAPMIAMFGLTRLSIMNRPVHEVFSDAFKGMNVSGDPMKVLTDVLRRADARPSSAVQIDASTITDLVFHAFPIIEPRSMVPDIGLIVHDNSRERATLRIKDELLSVVSHEFRTPMASILGFAELLHSREFSREEQRDLLAIVLDESRQLNNLFNDFMDLSRLEDGVHPVQLGLRDPQWLVDRAVEIFPFDDAHPILVDVEAHLPSVLVDAELAQKLFAHLLSNAQKFSPSGGPITLTAERRGSFVLFGVADLGLGIPSASNDSIFEKLHRVDLADRRLIRGTGLGLPICRHIVTTLKGRIWVESGGVDAGSLVLFTLPIDKGAIT